MQCPRAYSHKMRLENNFRKWPNFCSLFLLHSTLTSWMTQKKMSFCGSFVAFNILCNGFQLREHTLQHDVILSTAYVLAHKKNGWRNMDTSSRKRKILYAKIHKPKAIIIFHMSVCRWQHNHIMCDRSFFRTTLLSLSSSSLLPREVKCNQEETLVTNRKQRKAEGEIRLEDIWRENVNVQTKRSKRCWPSSITLSFWKWIHKFPINYMKTVDHRTLHITKTKGCINEKNKTGNHQKPLDQFSIWLIRLNHFDGTK